MINNEINYKQSSTKCKITRRGPWFRVESCYEIKVEKIKSAQFIGEYFGNILINFEVEKILFKMFIIQLF